MKIQKSKLHIISVSLLAALSVGLINTASAMIAYNSFMPKKHAPEFEALITEDETETVAPTSTSEDQASESTPATVGATLQRGTAQAVRKPNTIIGVGSKAQPAQVVKAADGTVTYKWCSGVNPNLEDGVCEAILSVASDPTASNPHLSDKARQSLSLLPKDSSLVMDESSWVSTSATSGTMRITFNTAAYGSVPLKIFMEKQNGIWILSDGQLA